MWVVKKFEANTYGRYPHIDFVNEYALKVFRIGVLIAETETGQRLYFDNTSPREFRDTIRRYNPYGFVDTGVDSDGVTWSGGYIVPIDDLSWKMLDFVESVDKIQVPRSTKIFTPYAPSSGAFEEIVPDRTLLHCLISRGCCCTLFHAMCFNTDCWVNDEFHIYIGKGDCRNQGGMTVFFDTVFRIKFCDFDGAKRLLAKAAVSGINPVRQLISY